MKAPSWITIRDAATLEPIGAPIEPEGFAGGCSPSSGRIPVSR